MLALANSVSLLLIAVSSDLYEEKAQQTTAPYGTVRHSTAPHGRARHRTAGLDTARHRSARRRAVELPKLSRAGVLFLCFQLAGCDLRKNEIKT